MIMLLSPVFLGDILPRARPWRQAHRPPGLARRLRLVCREIIHREQHMEQRKLGKSSIEVAPLTFGGNVFGWTADEAMSFRLLDGFVAAGFNFIDSADVYARWVPGNNGGESETIIGNWLKSRGGRDKVIIATKFGVEMAPGKKGLSRAYMMQAVDA